MADHLPLPSDFVRDTKNVFGTKKNSRIEVPHATVAKDATTDLDRREHFEWGSQENQERKKQTDKSGTRDLWNGRITVFLLGLHFSVPEFLSSRFKILFLIS